MQRALAVLMDPIEKIKIYKDSSFAMLLEAKRRGYSLHYLLQESLYIKDSRACARAQALDVFDNNARWFHLDAAQAIDLGDMSIILSRTNLL